MAKDRRRSYTVIMLDETDGTVISDTVRTSGDEYRAMGIAAKRVDNPGSTVVICAIKGKPDLLYTGCDSTVSAYATDMIELLKESR